MAENMLDKATDFIKDKAGDLLGGDTTNLKKQATDIGKKITPDQYDDKVEGVVDKAVDFLKDNLGKKK